MTRPDCYLIGLQASLSPGHRAHVLFHELVHVVRGHLDTSPADGGTSGCRAVDGFRADEPGGDGLRQREWEAEVGASILSDWAHISIRGGERTAGDPAARRLASALLGAPWT